MNLELLTKQLMAGANRHDLNLSESQARKMAKQMIRELLPAAQHRAVNALVDSVVKLSD